MKRSLVYQDGTSKKFWNITTDGKSFTVTFGKLGTAGQSQTKKLASDAACAKEAASLVASKLKKGYVDGKGGATKAAPKAAPKKAASKSAAPTKAAPKKPATKADAKAAPKKKLSPADAKALLRAIELGLVPKVKALVAKGDVDVVVKQKYGGKTTPLLDAAGRPNVEILSLVLGAGGKFTDTDDYGRSALQMARTREVAARLIDAGADVNARDRQKRTALHTAADSGYADVVELLLERGADVDPKDEEKKTPYASCGNLNVRAILKKFGSKGLEKTDGRPLKPKARKAEPDELDVDGGAIAVDHDGNVWTGGSNAIFRWDGKKLTAFEFEESFAVSEIARGPKGTLYFSTNWGLVVRVGEAFRLYSTEDSEIHDAHITELAVDRKGQACVMGYGGEETVDRPISVFDGKTFKVLTAGDGFPPGLETNVITFDEKNRLVLGTEDGVVFADGTKWKPPGSGGKLDAIRLLVPDGDELLVAAWRNVFRLANGKLVEKTEVPDGPKCIAVSGDTLFIGMSYGGLLRVKGSERKLFKEDSGLEEEDVEGLALAPDGTLWISAGNTVFQCRGDVIAKFDGKPLSDKPAAAPAKETPKAAPPKAEPKPKPKKLVPLPDRPLVPRAKLPAHVVAAFEAAKLEGLGKDALYTLVRPAIGLEIGKAAAIAVGGSKLGGRPDLAPGATWPTFDDEDDRYLPLLFQIDLADVAALDVEGLLPKKGRLCFFADTQPDELADSRVIYDDGAKKAARLAWPEDLVDRKDEDDFVAQLPEHGLTFYPTWTLPSSEYFARHAELTEVDRKTLQDLEAKIHAKDPKTSSTTRLLGWPNTLQGEILSSPDTIVLLQLDGQMKGPKKLDELFGYWGHGIAHYLVSSADLAKKKFSEASAELAYT